MDSVSVVLDLIHPCLASGAWGSAAPRHCCRTFERNYQLAEHVEVKGAWPETGLLHVDFVRETFRRR